MGKKEQYPEGTLSIIDGKETVEPRSLLHTLHVEQAITALVRAGVRLEDIQIAEPSLEWKK